MQLTTASTVPCTTDYPLCEKLLMNNSYKIQQHSKFDGRTYTIKIFSNLLKGKLFYSSLFHSNSWYWTKTKHKSTLFLLLRNAYFYSKVHKKKIDK